MEIVLTVGFPSPGLDLAVRMFHHNEPQARATPTAAMIPLPIQPASRPSATPRTKLCSGRRIRDGEMRHGTANADLDSSDEPRDPDLPVIWLTPNQNRTMPFKEIVLVTRHVS